MPDCTALCDKILFDFILASPSPSIEFLNVANCYRLGLGSPLSIPFRRRVQQFARDVQEHLPNIRSLDIRGVFTLSNKSDFKFIEDTFADMCPNMTSLLIDDFIDSLSNQ